MGFAATETRLGKPPYVASLASKNNYFFFTKSFRRISSVVFTTSVQRCQPFGSSDKTYRILSGALDF